MLMDEDGVGSGKMGGGGLNLMWGQQNPKVVPVYYKLTYPHRADSTG